MGEKMSCEVVVRGRVQGVGFRYFAEGEAQRLGLHGYVVNRSDGSVYVYAEGERNPLDLFLTLLRHGPPGAHVSDLAVTWGPARGDLRGFSLRFSS